MSTDTSSRAYASVDDLCRKNKSPLGRHVLNSFESVPQEGWQLIKKWIGKRQVSNNKLTIRNIERQAEVNTITPLIMAMFFTKDEDNQNRIPIFINNITVHITKAEEDEYRKKKFGVTVFKITIRYGSGQDKLVWSVYRSYWDFVKLHYRYRNVSLANLPPFPSLPKHYFQRQRRSPNKKKQIELNNPLNTPASLIDEETVMEMVDNTLHIGDSENTASTMSPHIFEVVKADNAVLEALENYFNQLVSSIPPCGYTNRICRFLEISTLGLYLAAKYHGIHGKEGFVVLQSRTDKEPKYVRQTIHSGLFCVPAFINRKRKPKWLIVRDSYLVLVDDPSEIDAYDVFLFDQSFDVHRLSYFGDKPNHYINNPKALSNAIANASHWTSSKSVLCVKNRQGVYHLRTKNERHARLFELSIQSMMKASIWCENHRFGSFAPVCHNTSTAWFVDARDYFWDISVALENAKETIYIHDWWLSPELYLRRPASENSEWRLDRLLRRKAHQGIKVYIIMYKEVAMALPLYSHLAKRTLLALSPNIYVQRHPSRALDVFHKDSIFFWAHHEKICVVDNEIAFIGGIDKCFGRYDTPGHILVDDFSPDSNSDRAQIWPGKDYSNPRIIDFHTLDKPFEDNMDRSTLPRMPWHDVSMRIVGQAARHVARHFVQRWNYLRRKKPSAPKRPTPMLLPVPDTNTPLDPGDDRLCHPHTCDSCKVQILRSVSSWSIGSVDHVEHSILDAYIESIRESKYFIYIENQFFVTSTKSGNTVIENGIGEAIVNRIIEARNRNEKWKAIIIIPLVPGFPANIDENEARTVRLIMQCQYLSISRGPNSIFAKLHAAGITSTHEYINFYGLRNWAELNGQYVTEQVYIHAKTMIVDDRRVIIGSANINERSQLGTRDSEIAACIEDTEYVDSMLNGVPFKAGKFAHSLRMRLMCEHVGLDVDQMDRDKYAHGDVLASQYLKQPVWDEGAAHDTKDTTDCVPPYVQVCVSPADGIIEKEKIRTEEENKASIKEDIVSSSNSTLSVHDLQVTEQEKTKVLNEYKSNSISMDRDPLTTTSSSSKESSPSRPRSVFGKRKSSKEDHLSFWATLNCDTDNNGDVRATVERQETPSFPKYYCSPSVMPLFFEKNAERLTVGQVYNILKDPLADAFQEFWHILARSNTDLFRRSFLVAPDNNIKNWNQYRHYIKMAKLFLGRTDTKHGGTKTTAAAAAVTTLPIIKHGGETIYDLLKHIKGHLVIWPSYFMEEEENEFLFPMDKIAPLEIFD